MSRKTELFDVSRIENGIQSAQVPELTTWILAALMELSQQESLVAINGDYLSVVRFFIPAQQEVRLHVEATMTTQLIAPAVDLGDANGGHLISTPDSLSFVEERGKIGEHAMQIHAQLDSQGLRSIPLEDATDADSQEVRQDDVDLLAWFTGVIHLLNSRLETLA